MKSARPARYGLDWTREESVLAFDLYCRIPFKKTKANNPEVIKLAPQRAMPIPARSSPAISGFPLAIMRAGYQKHPAMARTNGESALAHWDPGF